MAFSCWNDRGKGGKNHPSLVHVNIMFTEGQLMPGLRVWGLGQLIVGWCSSRLWLSPWGSNPKHKHYVLINLQPAHHHHHGPSSHLKLQVRIKEPPERTRPLLRLPQPLTWSVWLTHEKETWGSTTRPDQTLSKQTLCFPFLGALREHIRASSSSFPHGIMISLLAFLC